MKKLSIIIVALIASLVANAQGLVLPDLLKGDLVLQQSTNANIWGKAKPGAKVTVVTSWNNATYSTVAEKDSLWKVKVATPAASFNEYDIEINSGKETIILENVLIGDVWLCGGQSNMEMKLGGLMNCYVEDAYTTIATSGKYKGLRYVTVDKVTQEEEVKGFFPGGSWTKSGPGTAANMSACGFHFGAMLTESLDIPIGLISCNWSGSFIEDWMDKDLYAKYPDQPVFGVDRSKAPTKYYYGMMLPTSNYTIKGMIFYQGESNVGSPDYAERLAATVALWRKNFELEKMPFYIVELAPFEYKNDRIEYENVAPFLREQQYKAVELIPDAGIVCTNDLAIEFDRTSIHPAKKKEVGQRLAALAISKAYGYGNPAESPMVKSVDIEENGTIAIAFTNVVNGIAKMGEIVGLEIAGEDRVFYPANGTVGFKFPAKRGDPFDYIVRVSSEKVPHPVAVRYAFKDYLIGNLHNTEGLPMAPFRTDNWDDVK